MEHGDAVLLDFLRGPVCVLLGVVEAVAAVRAGSYTVLCSSMTMVVIVFVVVRLVMMAVMVVTVVATEPDDLHGKIKRRKKLGTVLLTTLLVPLTR